MIGLSEWLYIVFYAVSAIFRPYNGGEEKEKEIFRSVQWYLKTVSQI